MLRSRQVAFGLFVSLLMAVLSAYFVYQTHEEASARTEAVRTQSEVQTLRAVVDLQRNELLSARSVGLLHLNPGPWEPYTATWYAQSGTTASGTQTSSYLTIATDPRVLPLGTVVEVEFANGTTRWYQAQDTGRLVTGRHIDIYDPSVKDCFDNGRHMVRLRILVKGR